MAGENEGEVSPDALYLGGALNNLAEAIRELAKTQTQNCEQEAAPQFDLSGAPIDS